MNMMGGLLGPAWTFQVQAGYVLLGMMAGAAVVHVMAGTLAAKLTTDVVTPWMASTMLPSVSHTLPP